MPTRRAGLVAASVNGIVYAIGGASYSVLAKVEAYDSDGYERGWRYLDVYDPTTNSWTTKAPMPTPRFAGAGGVLNGRLYVAGGRTGESGYESVPTLEAYYPATDTWSTRRNMKTARWSTAAAVVNRVLYVLGGARTSVAVTTNEAYTCC
jgi:N-acetylneuraminic acid mutarotase